MSSIHDEQVDQPQSSRLTFRQKFWLFGVGLPLLLVVISLFLLLWFPSPTERKIIGRWEIVSPVDRSGTIVDFRPDSYVYADSTPWLWHAGKNSLSTANVEHPIFWARLKLLLGLSSDVDQLRIQRLEENEMELIDLAGSVPVVYRRLEPPGETSQTQTSVEE